MNAKFLLANFSFRLNSLLCDVEMMALGFWVSGFQFSMLTLNCRFRLVAEFSGDIRDEFWGAYGEGYTEFNQLPARCSHDIGVAQPQPDQGLVRGLAVSADCAGGSADMVFVS